MAHRSVFGPVLSRRLGLSLGIDLIPFKTCSFNCAYCECGAYPFTIMERQDFIPAEQVCAELAGVLSSRPQLDSITFAGSGEPTLARSLGPVISWIRREYPEYTVSVLTNGSLLSDPQVCSELLPAGRVVPTLTSAFQTTFERIHHPHPFFRIDTIIESLVRFRDQYTGELWLEVFIIPGINTSDAELAGLKAAIHRIRPDLVQLNRLDRPAPEPWVTRATDEELEQVSTHLGSFPVDCPVEIVGRHPHVSQATKEKTGPREIVRAILSRKPSTCTELAEGSGLERAEVGEILASLERQGIITRKLGAQGTEYVLCEK